MSFKNVSVLLSLFGLVSIPICPAEEHGGAVRDVAQPCVNGQVDPQIKRAVHIMERSDDEGRCLITAISDSEAITAGHCIHNENTGGIKLVGNGIRSTNVFLKRGDASKGRGEASWEDVEKITHDVAIVSFPKGTFAHWLAFSNSETSPNNPQERFGAGSTVTGIHYDHENLVMSCIETKINNGIFSRLRSNDIARLNQYDGKVWELFNRKNNLVPLFGEHDDSGGPLLDDKGRVRGVLSASDTPANMYYSWYTRLSSPESKALLRRVPGLANHLDRQMPVADVRNPIRDNPIPPPQAKAQEPEKHINMKFLELIPGIDEAGNPIVKSFREIDPRKTKNVYFIEQLDENGKPLIQGFYRTRSVDDKNKMLTEPISSFTTRDLGWKGPIHRITFTGMDGDNINMDFSDEVLPEPEPIQERVQPIAPVLKAQNARPQPIEEKRPNFVELKAAIRRVNKQIQPKALEVLQEVVQAKPAQGRQVVQAVPQEDPLRKIKIKNLIDRKKTIEMNNQSLFKAKFYSELSGGSSLAMEQLISEPRSAIEEIVQELAELGVAAPNGPYSEMAVRKALLEKDRKDNAEADARITEAWADFDKSNEDMIANYERRYGQKAPWSYNKKTHTLEDTIYSKAAHPEGKHVEFYDTDWFGNPLGNTKIAMLTGNWNPKTRQRYSEAYRQKNGAARFLDLSATGSPTGHFKNLVDAGEWDWTFMKPVDELTSRELQFYEDHPEVLRQR